MHHGVIVDEVLTQTVGELLGCSMFEPNPVIDACVIHKTDQRAIALLDVTDGVFALTYIAQVSLEEVTSLLRTLHFSDERRHVFSRPAYDNNGGALLDAQARDCLSDAGTPTGYDYHLVPQSEIHKVPLTEIEVAPIEGQVCTGDERGFI
jgi:hypothetical protein